MHLIQGPVAQFVASMTADPDVAGLIGARFQTFMEIDHEIIPMAFFLLPLIQEALQ